MTTREMNRVVGNMVVSDEFRDGVLGGIRAELLENFNLTDEEREFLMSIRADTLPGFAAAVERYIQQQRGENLFPPPAVV